MVGYLPAESAVRVGGDWYHAQELPDGRAVLAVGDVAGHGMGAASGMAHLRFALIAWLSIGIDDPSVLLGHLNRLCLQLRITGTAVIGVYDPATADAGLGPGRARRRRCWPGTARRRRSSCRPGCCWAPTSDAAYPVLTPRLPPATCCCSTPTGWSNGASGRPDAAGPR